MISGDYISAFNLEVNSKSKLYIKDRKTQCSQSIGLGCYFQVKIAAFSSMI